MKRLLRISLDQVMMSLMPILAWFCLSLLVDKDLINVFTITYPLQCIYGIIRSPLAVGANISQKRDKNPNSVMTGLVLGIFLTLLIYGFTFVNVDSYISFMNMDASIYHIFVAYSIINLALQTIFSFILEKLYYEDQNSRANRYSITFNVLNFAILIGMAIVSKNQLVIVAVTSVVMTLYTVYVVAKNCDKFRPQINLAKCIKYDSPALASYVLSFFTFLFGLSNAMEFGPEFGLAITFVSLVTDTQWDVLDAVSTLAKVDLSQKKFNYKKSLRNAYTLLGLLFGTIAIMFVGLYHFYDLNLGLVLMFLGFEIFDFLISPAYYLRTAFLQLNWSAAKITGNRIVARFGRLSLSFLPTPFCNGFGQIFSTTYQLITTKYFFNKHFIIKKDGRISKRRTPRKVKAGYAYNDIIIDQK